jgi:hypothetical protein
MHTHSGEEEDYHQHLEVGELQFVIVIEMQRRKHNHSIGVEKTFLR